MEIKKYVYINNGGKLEIIEPFNFLIGQHNRGKEMGKAKDKTGNTYTIRVAHCDFKNCYCGAEADTNEVIN